MSHPLEPQPAIALAQAGDGAAAPHEYALTSDLARLSLPQTFQDPNRVLGWINSIVFLFLCVGLVGLNPQRIIERAIEFPPEVVPVIFNPPEDEPPPQTDTPPEDAPEVPPETIVDQPIVATVVAPPDAKVAFAVPVKGPVIIAPSARLASPPPTTPPQQVAPPKPTTFNKSAANTGRYPDPPYPRTDLQARRQGKVMLYAIVDATGAATSVTVRDSCGWPTLDRHAADWVKDNWRWPPGETRHYLVPIIFQIR